MHLKKCLFTASGYTIGRQGQQYSLKNFLKHRPHLSSAEGKGISEATVGLEAKLILKTRNAKGEQCYAKRDSITVQIRNQQDHDCATKAQVQDDRDGASVEIARSHVVVLISFGMGRGSD